MIVRCNNCNAEMKEGVLKVRGVIGETLQSEATSNVEFVVPGPQPLNPIKAFKQGLEGKKEDKRFILIGLHCPECGKVDWFARPK